VRTTTDFGDLLHDPAIGVVIELIGGIEPARTFQLAALKAGKAVVTANKQLLSQHGAELLQTAEDNGTFLRFEASSVGAVPVVKVLRESLAASQITGIMGIVNGTTNYILSAMTQTGAQYGPTLAKARIWASPRPTRPGRVGQGRGRQDGDPLVDRLPQPGHAGRRRAQRHRRRHRHRRRPRQAARPRAQAARRGQADRRPRQRARLSVLHPRAHPLAGVSAPTTRLFLESDSFDRIMLFARGRRHADRLGG